MELHAKLAARELVKYEILLTIDQFLSNQRLAVARANLGEAPQVKYKDVPIEIKVRNARRRQFYFVEGKSLMYAVLRYAADVRFKTSKDDVVIIEIPTLERVVVESIDYSADLYVALIRKLCPGFADTYIDVRQKWVRRLAPEILRAYAGLMWVQCLLVAYGEIFDEVFAAVPTTQRWVAETQRRAGELEAVLIRLIELGVINLFPAEKEVLGEFLPAESEISNTDAGGTKLVTRPFSLPEEKIELRAHHVRDSFYGELPGFEEIWRTHGFFRQRNYSAYIFRTASGKRIAFLDTDVPDNAGYVFWVDAAEEWANAGREAKKWVRETHGRGFLIRVVIHRGEWEKRVRRLLQIS